MKQKRESNTINSPIRISLIYLIVSSLWIFFSDRIASLFFTSPESYVSIQLIKGILFVLSTSLLIYWLIKNNYEVISEQNKTLKESEERWQFALEGAGDGVWDWNAQTNKVYYSSRWKEMLGYSEDEINDSLSDWEKLIHPDDKKNVYDDLQKHLSGKTPFYQSQYRIKCKSGSYKWILDRGKVISRTEDGEPLRVIGTHTDINEQKLAEIKLLELTDFRDMAYQVANIGIWRYDIEKGIVYLDNRAQAYFGINQESIDINLILSRVHLEDIERLKNEMNEIINPNSDGKFTTEYRVVHKDGTTRWLQVNTHINFEGENRKPVSGFGTVNDITERKLFEIKLETTQFGIDNTQIGVYQVEEDGTIVYANKYACNSLGYSFEELIGMSLFEIDPTFDLVKFREHRKTIKGKGSGTVTSVHKRKDGTVFPVEVTINYFEFKGKQLSFSFVKDITEKKKAEEELKLLSRSVEQSPVSILITDSEGKIEYVNSHFRKITGFTQNEILGKTPRLLKSGYQVDEIYNNLWKTIKSGNNWEGELKNKKKNGELFWEHVVISPMVDSNNNVTHFVAVKEDITEKKKMIEELVAAKEIAESSNRLKTEFLAQMSHEIRSPLNAVVNLNSLIKEGTAHIKNEELDIAFSGIESASKRIIRTIDSILNMSELQLGSYQVSKRKVNLVKLLRTLITEYDTTLKIKNLDIRFASFSEIVEIETDDYAINQVFSNLIDNAIKYTREGFISISLKEGKENEYIVDVEDSGIGISEEYLPELFTAFTQEEQGYGRRFEGNGLGLALVKRYCDLIGAEIKVKSKKNVGSTFTVIIRQ